MEWGISQPSRGEKWAPQKKHKKAIFLFIIMTWHSISGEVWIYKYSYPQRGEGILLERESVLRFLSLRVLGFEFSFFFFFIFLGF